IRRATASGSVWSLPSPASMARGSKCSIIRRASSSGSGFQRRPASAGRSAETLLSFVRPAYRPEGRRIRMADRRSSRRMLAGAALLGVTHGARAQKAKSFTIGYLALLPGEDRNFAVKFLQRLGELGYADGQNLHFVYRSAEGRPELLPALAAELVQMKPDVLVTGFGTVAAKAGKEARDGIPVVSMSVG